MTNAVALFGLYERLPWVIRGQGRQPGYTGGHCVLVYQASDYVPPFLGEFDHETSKVADCVPVSGVRGVNYASRGAEAPATWQEREALQTAMGTQDAPADEAQLASGVSARYRLALAHGQSWDAILAALGGADALVFLGDPLGTQDIRGVRVGDLQPFASGLAYRYDLFTQPAPLPDTATEVIPVWTRQAKPANNLVALPTGTHVYDNPNGTVLFTVGAPATIHAVLQVPGWYGYVQGTGGVTWVAAGGLAVKPVPSYTDGVIAERAAAVKAVQASQP